jgi:predicted secreted protein
VEKKNDGKDFMKVKVKYFDQFLSRMNRAPIPKPPRGADGKELVSRFKQRSNAIRALSDADDKRLVEFIESQDTVRNTSGQGQNGTQGNVTVGNSGAAVAASKKRAHDGDEEDDFQM